MSVQLDLHAANSSRARIRPPEKQGQTWLAPPLPDYNTAATAFANGVVGLPISLLS